jgi:hypothetical protein
MMSFPSHEASIISRHKALRFMTGTVARHESYIVRSCPLSAFVERSVQLIKKLNLSFLLD